LGVTLTAADVVIFYDNDWNPTMDAQATDVNLIFLFFREHIELDRPRMFMFTGLSQKELLRRGL
jgi:hypothetical protein